MKKMRSSANFIEGGDGNPTLRDMRLTRTLLVLASLLCPGLARADVRTITVERGTAMPSCLEASGVAAALREDASLRVTVADTPEGDGYVLRITGTNERFTLLLTRGDQEIGQMFEGVSCDAATQVVVAFAVSVLESMPPGGESAATLPEPMPVTEVQGTDYSNIVHFIDEELESRGRLIAALGLELAVARNPAGNWVLWIRNEQEGCSSHRIFNFEGDESKEALGSRMTTAAISMLDTEKGCMDPALVKRLEVLAEALKAFQYKANPRHGATLEAIAGVSLGVSLALVDVDRKAPLAIGMGTALIWTGGGIASFAMGDDDMAGTVAIVTGLLGFGTGMAALAFTGEFRDSEDEIVLPDQIHGAPLIAGLALSATAGLLLADRLKHRPVTARKLVQHYKSIEHSRQRNRLSTDEALAIEDDLRRSSSPTSAWILVSPLLLGATANFIGFAVEDNAEEANMHLLSGLFLGAEGSLLALLSQTMPNSFERYQGKLRDAKLDVTLVPTTNGLALAGRF